MKKIIIIRGPLGVGKTTISKKLAKKLKADYISLDQILEDYNLIDKDEEGISVETFLKANKIIFDKIESKNKIFVIDGCFYYKKQINDIKNRFKNDLIIFTITSSLKKCIERDSKRKLSYGEDATKYVYQITMKEKVGTILDNTDLSVDATVEKIIKNLKP